MTGRRAFAAADEVIDVTTLPWQPSGRTASWTDAAADGEAGDVDGLLLQLNWLCDLLERMDRDPAAADRDRAACDALMARLLTACRTPEARDVMIGAGVWIAARRYRTAATALRAVAA